MQKSKIKKNVKQELFVLLDNLSFLEKITWWKETDLTKVGLPMPSSDTLRAWASHPKIKLDKVLDQKKNIAFSAELLNLLRWINVKIYLLVAKIYHQSKKILSNDSSLDDEEKNLFLNVRSKSVNIAKNMYKITNYDYYREIIEMR